MTKFAMVFFIILLAGIMISFSDTQKTAICRTQAQSMANNIASTLSNVINSPVEDERKVVSFVSSLSVGKSQLERYTINVTNIPAQNDPKTGSLVVHVLSGMGCEGYARASYDKTMTIMDPTTLSSRWNAGLSLEMRPSDIQKRDYYLIIAKCKPKQAGFSSYLYLRQCNGVLGTELNPETSCPPYLESAEPDMTKRLVANPLLRCCGWEAVENGGTPQCPAPI